MKKPITNIAASVHARLLKGGPATRVTKDIDLLGRTTLDVDAANAILNAAK